MPQGKKANKPAQSLASKSFTIELPASKRRTAAHSQSIQPAPTALAPIEMLPIELLKRITGQLARDGQLESLSNLARGSRFLYSVTLPHIYEDIHLSTERAYEGLLRAISSSRKVKGIRAGADGRHGREWQQQVQGIKWRPGGMENFRMTKRITLSDMPHCTFGIRLAAILNDRTEKTGGTGPNVLFPLAQLLRIAPTASALERAREGTRLRNRGPYTPFMANLCKPSVMCLDHVFGIADKDSILTGDGCSSTAFFLRSVLAQLPAHTWDHNPDLALSWHGPTAHPVFAHAGSMDLVNGPRQSFPVVRVYYASPWAVGPMLSDPDGDRLYAEMILTELRSNWFITRFEDIRSVSLNVPDLGALIEDYGGAEAEADRLPSQDCIAGMLLELEGVICMVPRYGGNEAFLVHVEALITRIQEAATDGADLHSLDARSIPRQWRDLLRSACPTRQAIMDMLLEQATNTEFWGSGMGADGQRRLLSGLQVNLGKEQDVCAVCKCE